MRLALALIGALMLAGAFGVNQTQPFAALSGTCAQSAVQVYSYATICAPSTSYADSILYTTSSTTSGGIWSGTSLSPAQVTNLGGFVKVYYLLAAGVTLTQFSATYAVGTTAPVTLAGLTRGTEASSLQWFGAPMPNQAFALNTVTTITASLKDSVGTVSTIKGYFRYVQSGYTVNFVIRDGTNALTTGQTPGLANVQILIKTSGTGAVAGQVVTDTLGKASISLAYGTFVASPTSPAGYFSAPTQSFNSWISPTLSWTLSKPAVITSVTLSSNTFTGCGQYDTSVNSCSITLTYSNTFTGTDGKTTTSGYTGTCYAVAGCTMTSSTTVIGDGTTSVTTTTESGTGSGGGSGSESSLTNSAITYTLGGMGLFLLIASAFMPPRRGGRK